MAWLGEALRRSDALFCLRCTGGLANMGCKVLLVGSRQAAGCWGRTGRQQGPGWPPAGGLGRARRRGGLPDGLEVES